MNHQRLTYPDVARIVGTGLISTGVGLLFFVFVTVAWGDPFTKLSEHNAQEQLERAYAASFDADNAALRPDAGIDSRTTRGPARVHRKSLSGGEVAGRLTIPRINLQKYVVKGASEADLAKGPGVYDETGFPGSGAPVAIAGHRTTHGAPFLDIDKLKPGDRIVMDMPYGRFTYFVTRTKIIANDDWSILAFGAAERNAAKRKQMQLAGQGRAACPDGSCEHVVLTACHPKYSAAQRIAVFARLGTVALRRPA